MDEEDNILQASFIILKIDLETFDVETETRITECYIIKNLLTELARVVLGNIVRRANIPQYALGPIFPSTARASSVSKRLILYHICTM